jgi:hypothetical protein
MSSAPKIALDEDQPERQVACGTCNRETWHTVLASVSVSGETEYLEYWETYQIVMCQGCRTVSFANSTRTSEDFDYDDQGNLISVPSIKLYPSRLIGRKKLDWSVDMPGAVYRIYDETHAALCNNVNVLAGIGIRAIIETVCKQSGAAGSNLKEKINALVNRGLVTPSGSEILHQLRFLGNDAAHEVKAHSTEDLGAALDVVEHLLAAFYVLPELARQLSKPKNGSGKPIGPGAGAVEMS